MTSETTRDACLRSFLALLAERPFTRIALGDVAERCGVSLAEMRASYASSQDLLAAFFRSTDRHVLSEGGPDAEDFAGEGPKERLFEVLMRRLDALEPHREAVRSLRRSARRDPLLALHLLRLSETSQRWMVASAGLDCTGLAGSIRAKGLAVLFARVLDVWLEDEDPGLARTMATLDQELERGAKLLGMLDDVAYLAIPWRKRRASAATGQDRPAGEAAPAAGEPAA
ncbi:UNVERIFIED_ORG: AcrR family transcriptional regulator [Xanthobacter viscosus]|jgi:AcrR family transcriptional regulator|uniref:TetR/AcrR family transcriptional regulator n=1 Tax=Xanthobacter autotrophicus TaxID=280 RepID=A0A6C1KA64_XANAU|nr:TetR/AcrR family transcriptional regulator [Xanthobacter autotrophicus]TLX41209.1 TetR/AcrR family transcriptional regulator [Xanthobacter autotrophicus]